MKATRNYVRTNKPLPPRPLSWNQFQRLTGSHDSTRWRAHNKEHKDKAKAAGGAGEDTASAIWAVSNPAAVRPHIMLCHDIGRFDFICINFYYS